MKIRRRRSSKFCKRLFFCYIFGVYKTTPAIHGPTSTHTTRENRVRQTRTKHFLVVQRFIENSYDTLRRSYCFVHDVSEFPRQVWVTAPGRWAKRTYELRPHVIFDNAYLRRGLVTFRPNDGGRPRTTASLLRVCPALPAIRRGVEISFSNHFVPVAPNPELCPEHFCRPHCTTPGKPAFLCRLWSRRIVQKGSRPLYVCGAQRLFENYDYGNLVTF